MQTKKQDIAECTNEQNIGNSGYTLNELDNPDQKKLQFLCTNKLKFSFSLIITTKEFEEKDINWLIQTAENKFTKDINKNGIFQSVKLNKIPYDQQFKEKLANYQYNQIKSFTHLFPIYFTTDDRQVKIFIKESTQNKNQAKEMTFLLSTTVKDVILEYGYQINKDFENVSLTFYGHVKAFDISKSLEQCQVTKDGMYIDIIEKNYVSGDQAGSAFVNMKQIPKEIGFSQNAPKWRYADKGLNIEGYCKNGQCEAHGKLVIHMAKLGAFDLIKDRKTIVCPMCKKFFKPEQCGFTLCQYTITGKYVDDEDGEERFIEPITKSASGKSYLRYDAEGGKNNLSYVQLTISTEPLKKEIGELNNELAQDCSLCCSEIADGQDFKQPCNYHKCHNDCLEEVTLITKSTQNLQFNKCPSCDRSG